MRAVCLLLVCLAAPLSAAATSWLADPGFDAITKDAPGRWEVRYGRKASEPDSRPRWQPIIAADTDDPARGQHIWLKQTGRAAGTVWLGQRLTVPAEVGSVEFALDYQTFCPMDGRSGQIDLVIFTPAEWDKLAREPEAAQDPPESALLKRTLHPNRDDVTSWQRTRYRDPSLKAALAALAGGEVVVAIAWSTWHPTSDEWARFDNFHLGPSQPYVALGNWPRFIYRGEPVTLRVQAEVGAAGAVLLGWQPVGAGPEDWQWAPMAAEETGGWAAALPAEATAGPVTAIACLRQPGEPDQFTEAVALRLTERPVHPNILYTAAELAAMREKINQFDWAKAIFEREREIADSWLANESEPVVITGGWSHDYVCPDDGARLRARQDHPHDHLCPSCQKEWQSEKLDAVWAGNQHSRFASAAATLGLVYQLTGDERYARRGINIVVWYARHYAAFPLGRGPAGRGKVHSQSLTECSWLVQMIGAADLLYQAMTAEERSLVEQDLIRASAEHCSQFNFRIHNIQCWHNASMGLAGYFLGDPEMVERANGGRYGLEAQIAEGILPDGMWYERSLGYHNFTLSALAAHLEAARRNGDDYYLNENVQRMFTLPLRLSQPNLVPPSLNDQGYSRGRIGTAELERAWGWYRDEDSAQALRLLYDLGASRNSRTSLQYGEPLPEGGVYTPPASEDFAGTGLVVLRQGRGDGALAAYLEYGEHGGGHGHPDKLQLILYGLGRTLAPDLGTTGYGVPLHGRWYKTTPSHNTVTIGEKNQASTTGKLLAFVADANSAAATAESTGAYPGYRLVRRLLLTERYLVDLFDVVGETAATMDWFLRAPGTLAVSPAVRPDNQPAANATYAYLSGLQTATTSDQWTATWEQRDQDAPAGTFHLTVAGAPGSEVGQCQAPGLTGEPPWDTLRIRRQAATTQFAVVYQFVAPGDSPEPVSLTPDRIRIGGATVRIGNLDAALAVE